MPVASTTSETALKAGQFLRQPNDVAIVPEAFSNELIEVELRFEFAKFPLSRIENITVA